MIRQYALVDLTDEYKDRYFKGGSKYPYHRNLLGCGPYIFLGEIPNMPDHCVVISHRLGTIFSGCHIEDFRELTEDET